MFMKLHSQIFYLYRPLLWTRSSVTIRNVMLKVPTPMTSNLKIFTLRKISKFHPDCLVVEIQACFRFIRRRTYSSYRLSRYYLQSFFNHFNQHSHYHLNDRNTQVRFLDASFSAAEGSLLEVVGATLNVATLMQRVLNEIYS